MSKNNKNLHSNQRGMVAIMVTVILMIVISLIVLGFSQVIRREQRQALDHQLSSQAFYAAESGVNLAREALRTKPNLTKDTCPENTDVNGYTISSADNVRITCLLIENIVSEAVYDDIGMNADVGRIDPVSPINTIYINWETPNTTDVSGGCGDRYPSLPREDNWDGDCNQPVLRIDLVPLTANMTQNSLQASQFTAFLYPNDSNGTTPALALSGPSGLTGNNAGKIVRVNCNDNIDPNKPRMCMVPVNNLPAASSGYGFRIMSVYGSASVTIHATNGGTSRVGLKGIQALIDSTAIASDISHRVQARVPIGSRGTAPDFAVSSEESLCKKYEISGNTINNLASLPSECRVPGW